LSGGGRNKKKRKQKGSHGGAFYQQFRMLACSGSAESGGRLTPGLPPIKNLHVIETVQVGGTFNRGTVD
jgi:hypothetical protein